MKDVASMTRKKKIVQLTAREFREGKWCSDVKLIPNNEFVKVEFTMKNGILVVHDFETTSRESVKEEDLNGRSPND